MTEDGRAGPTGASRFAEKMKDPEFRQAYLDERRKLDLGETVLELMDELGVSQAELARRLGVSPSTVSRLLGSGHLPRLDSLMRVLDALHARMEVRFEVERQGSQAPRKIMRKVSYRPDEDHPSEPVSAGSRPVRMRKR